MTRRWECTEADIAAIVAADPDSLRKEPAPDWLSVFLAGQLSTPTPPRRTWPDRLYTAATAAAMVLVVGALFVAAVLCVVAAMTP